ncbi:MULTISPECIES: lactate utilization protein B [Kocuria]|uniref:lactate utilization protein B n=1 Tax=Kocuria TaxID=57493 RepID=UPI0006616557|nr:MULTISPECIES: lactate utilization protein B [Kocuria]MCT1368527.1 lactate utilization protein [Rothia sp. p3-SID1597]RUQ23273.1 lactate utilization protein [Kocuria sp. HSID16901]
MTVTSLGMPKVHHGTGNIVAKESFTQFASRELKNEQLRENLGFATHTIRDKRLKVVSELPDWELLRTAGSEIKQDVMARLPELLEEFEKNFTERGGHVHWARDANEANQIALDIIREQGVEEVIKIKSMATQETGLNEFLEEQGVSAIETDLAEEIVQMGDDKPSHILVPAIHRNRSEIRDIFLKKMPGIDPNITDQPSELAEASRHHLREKFFRNTVAISGANFGVADSGTLTIVESEGNGRMCLTLPDTLISFMGIEKLVPTFQDLEVFLQLLPRSSTGERMNPYTSMWSGVTPGDGPQNLHVILMDNGRTAALADEVGRQALHCIRCSACMNVCPVYERAGGHAYGSVYPGPIGAILSPLMTGVEEQSNNSLPYASSLCGACYEACPVKINIPDVLVHLRGKDIDAKHGKGDDGEKRHLPDQMDAMMAGAKEMFSRPFLLSTAVRGLPVGRIAAGRSHKISWLPGLVGGWTKYRDIPEPPSQAFRHWWKKNRKNASQKRTGQAPVDVQALLAKNEGLAQKLHEEQALKAKAAKDRAAEQGRSEESGDTTTQEGRD